MKSEQFAVLYPYDQIGIKAIWIVTICRIVQGVFGMGQATEAELYLSEVIELPFCHRIVASMLISGVLAGVFVLAISSFVNYFIFDWRVVFWLGAIIAFSGAIARIKLREIRNILNINIVAKKQLENTNTEKEIKIGKNSQAEYNLSRNNIVAKKTSLAYFLIEWTAPLWFYITYIYSSNILKNLFGYTLSQIILHNLIIVVVEFLGAVIITYLVGRVPPLKILQIKLIIFSIFIPIFCVGLNYISTPHQLSLFQAFICLLAPTSFPAFAIFYKSFSILKRYRQVNLIFNLSRTLMYIIASFGTIVVTSYCDNLGLLLIILPVLGGYKHGLYYFKKLKNY